MKNKKERTIEAMEEIALRYRKKNQSEALFISSHCPLCRVHQSKTTPWAGSCKGCPLADDGGGMGCLEFKSYRKAYDSGYKHSLVLSGAGYSRKALLKRAKFFEDYAIPAMKDIPKKQFTKTGWKHFNLDTTK